MFSNRIQNFFKTMKGFINFMYYTYLFFGPYDHDFYINQTSIDVDQQSYVDVILNHGLAHTTDLLKSLQRLSRISRRYITRCTFDERHSRCQKMTVLSGPCGAGGFLHDDLFKKECTWRIRVEKHFRVWLTLHNIRLPYGGAQCPGSHVLVTEPQRQKTNLTIAKLCGISKGKQYFTRGDLMQISLAITVHLRLGYSFVNSRLIFDYQAIAKRYLYDIQISNKTSPAPKLNLQWMTSVHYNVLVKMFHINTFLLYIIRVSFLLRYHNKSRVGVFDGLSSKAPLLDAIKNSTHVNFASSLFVVSICIYDYRRYQNTPVMTYSSTRGVITSKKYIWVIKPEIVLIHAIGHSNNIRNIYRLVTKADQFINLEILELHNFGSTEYGCYTGGIMMYNTKEIVGPVCGTHGMSAFGPNMTGVTFGSNTVYIILYSFIGTGDIKITMRVSSTRCEGIINEYEKEKYGAMYSLRFSQIHLKERENSCVRFQIFNSRPGIIICKDFKIPSKQILNVMLMLTSLPQTHQIQPAASPTSILVSLASSNDSLDYLTGHVPSPTDSDFYTVPYGKETHYISASYFVLNVLAANFVSLDSAISLTFTYAKMTCHVTTIDIAQIYILSTGIRSDCMEINILSPSYGVLILADMDKKIEYHLVLRQNEHDCLNHGQNAMVLDYRSKQPDIAIVFVWIIRHSKSTFTIFGVEIKKYTLYFAISFNVSQIEQLTGHTNDVNMFNQPRCNTSTVYSTMTIQMLNNSNYEYVPYEFNSKYCYSYYRSYSPMKWTYLR